MAKAEAVLLVEDNPDDIFLMKRAMQRAGVTNPVFIVEDGQEAIDYLFGQGRFSDRKRFPLPVLVVLDLKLPLLSGHDVLERIRALPALENIVVVVLSSSQEAIDVERAYTSGANSYLVKPSTMDKLLDVARALNEYWLQLNEFCPMKA
jgi:CheY-like chemotaxis protein